MKGDVFLYGLALKMRMSVVDFTLYQSLLIHLGFLEKKIGKFMDGVPMRGLEEWLVTGKHYRVGVTVMLKLVLNLILFSTVIRILFVRIRL